MMKKVTIFLMVIMCVFVMSACSSEISFIQTDTHVIWNDREAPPQLITSYEELLDLSNENGEIETYDEDFFEENALIIVGFPTSSGGGVFENVRVTRVFNHLEIEYDFYGGAMAVMSYAKLTLIVSQESVSGCKYVDNNGVYHR